LRFQNKIAGKVTQPEHFNREQYKKVLLDDFVKVIKGDVIKFGRVRFKVREIVTVFNDNLPKKTKKNQVAHVS
jgi:hypothetical protein